jgi:hypothetical protein
MSISFRTGFYAGLGFALALSVYLIFLWLPEHQIQRHTENLFHAIENKDWGSMAEFFGNDYRDQWGYDRASVLEHSREVFQFLRDLRINASHVVIRIEGRTAYWTGKIDLSAEEGELSGAIKERIHSLKEPFTLEWRRVSVKPWDWKLVRVGNPELEIPEKSY